MKKITLLLLLITVTSVAQVEGNKTIETRFFNIENIERIKINFYAYVTIDASAKEGMTITTDSNLFHLIEKEVLDNTLNLNQKEWISPSEKAIITIGAPNLKYVETNTHNITSIKNINNDTFSLLSPIGTVIIQGKTKQFNLGLELAKVDASKLISENAYINIWSWGNAKVNVTNEIKGKIINSGKLIYLNEPRLIKTSTKKGGIITSIKDINTLKKAETKYISFKIKNNSANRNHFYVVGPKADGTKFSYGFPMMPMATRKENWSVGTKIYKVNSIGLRKLLITIEAKNEDETVRLF